MMSALPLASAHFNKVLIPFLNQLLDGNLCKNSFHFHILSFFSGSNHDFVINIDFTHVAATNIAADDVTN